MLWFKRKKEVDELAELKQKILRLVEDLNKLAARTDGFEATLRHAGMIIEQPKGRPAREFTSNERQ